MVKNFENFLLEEKEQGEVKTWGGLRALIKSLISKKRLDAAKSGAVNILVDQVAGLIPGMSNIKTAFDFFKNIYTADDNKKTRSWIDKLNVDDQFSMIVDDSVEDQFIKDLVKFIESKNADEKLPDDFNINNELVNFLSRKYQKRTLIFNK